MAKDSTQAQEVKDQAAAAFKKKEALDHLSMAILILAQGQSMLALTSLSDCLRHMPSERL